VGCHFLLQSMRVKSEGDRKRHFMQVETRKQG